MIEKKVLLVASTFVSVALVIIGSFGTYTLCSDNEKCIEFLHLAFLNFIPILPLFLFSLITYKMRDDIYRTWLTFALVWTPLSMFLILIAPEYSHDWMYRIEKGTVAFGASVLFCLVSTILIIHKWYALRGK